MITDILQNLFSVAKKIYEQVELAKANQAQCQLLKTRIEIVMNAIKDLDKMKESDHYKSGLEALEKCLHEALNLIHAFAKSKSWFKKVMKASTADEKFKTINEQLQKCMHDLNLGMVAQQIVNREQDVKAQQKDFDYIQKNQDLILKLNQEAKKDLGLIKLQQQEHAIIMVKQFASMQAKLNGLNKPKSNIDPHFQIPYFQLRFEKKLGIGSFGKVYSGLYRKQKVAIKMIERNLEKDQHELFIREVQIMSRLHSPHIVQLYGACIEPDSLCLVMECMEQGSLDTFLAKGALEPNQQKEIALSIARGLDYIHSKNMIHCDLKSANILLSEKGIAKIADFGLSRVGTQSIIGITQKSQAIEWQAPECLTVNPKFTPASDIYAFGMIMWEIVTGSKPFADVKTEREKYILEMASKGQRETLPLDVDPCYRDLIEACWQTNPSKRPSLETVIERLEAYQPAQINKVKIAVQDKTPFSPIFDKLTEVKRNAEAIKATEVVLEPSSNAALRFGTFSPKFGSPSLKQTNSDNETVQSPKEEGEKYYQRGLEAEKAKNCASAFRNYQAAVKLGHPKAHTNLGFFYLQGLGCLQKDLGKAHELFLKAAEAGHTRAMINLASMYKHGKGVSKDETQALEWYKKAATLGDANAIAASMKLQSNLQTQKAQGAKVKPVAKAI